MVWMPIRMNLMRRGSSNAIDKENAPTTNKIPTSNPVGLKQPAISKPQHIQRIRSKEVPAAELLSPARGAHQSSSSAVGPESEYVVLEDWSFAFNASRPLQLTGRCFNNAAGYEDGDLLEYTSQITSINGRTAVTKSGTVYTLGKPAASFDQLRKQLWINSRTGALGRDDGSSVPPLDFDNPLLGIKLGEVKQAAPVRLPRVAGWSHQSGIALLNDWSPERNATGSFSVVGTVFNCPGAYDGNDNHRTATVVDCRGRLLVTIEGAEYYLGYRANTAKEDRHLLKANEVTREEVLELGLTEEMLAV